MAGVNVRPRADMGSIDASRPTVYEFLSRSSAYRSFYLRIFLRSDRACEYFRHNVDDIFNDSANVYES